GDGREAGGRGGHPRAPRIVATAWERLMVNGREMLLGGTGVAPAVVTSSVVPAWGQATTLKPEGIAWLKANAIPLATAEPGSRFEDLEPLRATIGNARVVGLGEATHGTREFFQLKHRMIEYCVSQLGFTVIAFG